MSERATRGAAVTRSRAEHRRRETPEQAAERRAETMDAMVGVARASAALRSQADALELAATSRVRCKVRQCDEPAGLRLTVGTGGREESHAFCDLCAVGWLLSMSATRRPGERSSIRLRLWPAGAL